MADDMSFKLLFKKDDCRAYWRSMEENKLEFLLIKGDQSKMCVMDVSNNYTRDQLRSLFQLFKDSIRSLPTTERNEPRDNPETSQPDETPAEAFQPIALPWYRTEGSTKMERSTARKKYIETFGEEPDYICKKCFKRFKQKGNLQRHENTVHGVKEQFTCETCGAKYKHKQHFEDHVKMHEGYMHQCEICLEGFPSRNAQKAHKRDCGQETVTAPVVTKRRKETCDPFRATGPLPKFKIPFDCQFALKPPESMENSDENVAPPEQCRSLVTDSLPRDPSAFPSPGPPKNTGLFRNVVIFVVSLAGTLPITLYSVGTYNQTNYTHVISTTSSTQALFGTVFATTANVEYNLDGLAVSGPSADCSIDCLWSLNALTNSTSPSAVMARWGDSYPLLTNQTTWAPVYCAKTQNYCGASIPLYLYYNGKRDYYVSNDGKGPSNGTAAYSFASVNNIMPGTALCYVWPMPTTTTISTTPYTGTTTKYTGPTTTYTGSTATGSTTPYTGPTTMTTPYTGPTTTTTPYTGPTTTTTPYTGPSTTTTAYTVPTTTTTPYTGPSTTATIYTGSTTTTKPYTGPTTTTTPYTGPSTTKSSDSSTSSSNSSGSGWWKWVLIGVGVILIAGIIIGLLGLVTVMFINPQPVKRNVAPYAPNSNVLPPQPVHAAPTPQPLTVGPTGGYPPM